MGLLTKLFGSRRQPGLPYPEAGVQLTRNIVQALNLTVWQNGTLEYTEEETEAINRELSAFQHIANRTVGGEARFHPDAVETIQQPFIAQALEDLAGRGWKYSAKTDLPEDWKARVSTYLKAWLCQLNPSVLLDVADLLARAGCKSEAKQALQVVILFPIYARTHFEGAAEDRKWVNAMVEEAHKALQSLSMEVAQTSCSTSAH